MRASNYDRVWIPARFLDRLQAIHDDIRSQPRWWWILHPFEMLKIVDDVRGLIMTMLNQRG